MPTIKQILTLEAEAQAQNRVLLSEEGLFYKAYEMSAFILVKRYGFKPTKRYIKAIDKEVITVGFPKSGIDKYLANAQPMEKDNAVYLYAQVYDVRDERAFADWKTGTPLKQSKPKEPPVPKVPQGEEYRFDPYAELPKNYYCDSLPVFRYTAAVLEYLLPRMRHLTKDYRYTIGQDIVKALIGCEKGIVKAWRARNPVDRMNMMDYVEDLLLEVKLELRLLHEVKQLDARRFAVVSEKMVLVEKHLASWHKHQTPDSVLPV